MCGNHFLRYIELCGALLERGWLPKEEDTIKDVIRGTFEQLWFTAAEVTVPITAISAPGTQRSAIVLKSALQPGIVTPAAQVSDTTAAREGLPSGWTVVKLSKQNLGGDIDESTGGLVVQTEFPSAVTAAPVPSSPSEIVSEPDLGSPQESHLAADTLTSVTATAIGEGDNENVGIKAITTAVTATAAEVTDGHGLGADAATEEGRVVYISPTGFRVASISEAWAVETGGSAPRADQNDVTGPNCDAAADTATATVSAITAMDGAVNVATAPGLTHSLSTDTTVLPAVHVTANGTKTLTTACVTPQTVSGSAVSGIGSVATEATAKQMIGVLATASSWEWMVQLVRGVLHGKAEGDEAKKVLKARREGALVQCERLVAELVNLLLTCEEERKLSVLNSDGVRVVAAIGAIAVFCEAHPPFLTKHLSVLLPYLKVSQKQHMRPIVCLCSGWEYFLFSLHIVSYC